MKENFEYKKNIIEGGLSHLHTEMSEDAILKIDEIGEYVKKHMRSEYFIINDHLTSPYKGKQYSESEVCQKIKTILTKVKEYNKSHDKPKCISGVEANIITNGIDIPDSVLAEIDFVIASRHFPWGQEESFQIVDNLIEAMNNPHVDAIGHSNLYVPKTIDWKLIFQTAEKTNTIIEINLNTPPSQEILQVMSQYELLYTIGVDFHTFQGFKRRVPINSEVVTDFAEAKKLAKTQTDSAEKLKREYIEESMGFNTLKKFINLMRRVEDMGIDTNKIVNALNLDSFLKFIKKPKKQRIL